MHKFLIQREKKNIDHYIYDMFHHGLEYIYIFFWFPTMYPQNFQSETNHCLRRVDPSGVNPQPREFFKVQVSGLKLGSTLSRTQDKHFETKCPTTQLTHLGLKYLFLLVEAFQRKSTFLIFKVSKRCYCDSKLMCQQITNSS